MNRRALLTVAAASVVSFALVLGALMALASSGRKLHPRIGHPAGGAAVAAAAGGAEFSRDECTIVWTGRGANENWHTAANWAPIRLPGREDVACIPGGARVVIKHDVTVKRFVNHGDLVIDGGNVNVASGASG